MKRRLLFVLFLLGAACPFSVSARAADAPAPVVAIAPHRAVYTMTLSKVKNGSPIQDANGTMIFEWGDACDGWAIQQHMKIFFNYAEGDTSEMDSSVVSWEAKDGKKYNFNVRRLSNGKEEEAYRGRASLGDKGGAVHYTLPKDKKDVDLAPDEVFPSAHTVLILRKAMEGEKMFTRRVFDGSDQSGASDVSAFIGNKQDKLQDTEMNPELRKNPLLDQPAWPVRLAFYKPDTQTGEPDYEMDLLLQANGIARSMTIDYGDFSISGVLAQIEPAATVSCPADAL